MFELLFRRPHTLARMITAPLAEERRRYLRHLDQQQLSKSVLRHVAYYLGIVVERLQLTDDSSRSVSMAAINRQALSWSRRHYFRPMARRRACSKRFKQTACAWLRFMGRLQAPKPRARPFASEIAAFTAYMADEQGLAPSTICHRIDRLQDLFSYLPSRHVSWRDVTVVALEQALARKLARRQYRRATVSLMVDALRSFLRFAARQRWCSEALVTGIRAPRIYSGEVVPWGPSWQDVQRLLATTAGDSAAKVRNRAILLLLAVYGLRAGEVVQLRLEDFDWQQERLKIRRPKQRCAQEFPLVHSVGDAVLRYLRIARPRSSYREVFLTCRAPFHPLHSTVLWQVVALPLRALGVRLPHQGPHCLRHACATHLLNAGLSLKEIGDQLGHRDPNSTRTYTKVDLRHLREVGDTDLRPLLCGSDL